MSIEAIIAKYGLFALFLGAGIEGETVVIAGGLLAHEGMLPLPGAMIAAATGSFVADQLFFATGRYFRGRAWVKKVSAKPAFAKALAALEKHPIGFIFAFRFIYGFRTISPVAIGTTKVRTKLFLAINAVAAIVWGVAFTSIGYVFGNGFARLLGKVKPDHHVTMLIVGGVIGVGVLLGLWRWWRGRAPVAEGQAPAQERDGA